MLLATWNVNSIRARLPRLLAWLQRTRPDVVLLQEVKVAERDFPFGPLGDLGYHAVVHGQPAYNGVAILSRSAAAEIERGIRDDVADEQARLVSAVVDGVRVMSVYAPNGHAVGSDKWAYKLAWFERLREWLARTVRPDEPVVLGGDWNVAPEDRDVARPDQWRDTVLCHEDARHALRRLLHWGLHDAVRLHHPGPGPWTWWDYRLLAFPRDNGLRIDHLFLTAPLASRCSLSWVERDERKGPQPSDHAPVLVQLEG
jgi:exodeoxyribonuclease-3